MPIRKRVDPNQPEAPTEGPSTLQRLLAGGVRAGSGLLATEGGLPGAGIAGAGEGIAELIEGDTPSITRMGVEAGLGAVPFSKVITAGRPWLATVRSGLFSGAGEAGREVARGEDLQPSTIAKSAGLGALFGNVFGRFGGPKTETPPAGPSYEIEHTAVPGGRVLGAEGKLVPAGSNRTIQGSIPQVSPEVPSDPRSAYWAKQGLEAPVAPGMRASANRALPFEAGAEEAVQGGRVPYTGSGAFPTGSAAKSAARAAKEAERLAQQTNAQNRINQAIIDGKLTPGATTVSESGSAMTPEGRISFRQGWKTPPKEEDAGVRVLDDAEAESVFEQNPTTAPELDVPPSPLSKLGKVLTPQQEAQQRSYDELLARLKGEGAPQAPEASVAPPVTPEGPSSPWLKAEDIGPTTPLPESTLPAHLLPSASTFPSPGWAMGEQGALRSEDVPQEVEPSLERLLSPSNLERQTPTFKGFEPVSEGGGAAVEGATQGLNPLATLFKSRVDAAGQGYRDIKEALRVGEAVPEEGRAIAGKALRQEAQAVGLPTTQPPKAVVPEEPRPSGIGPSQTAKAREAALAKRQASKDAIAQESAKTAEWLPGYEAELAEAQRMKDAGASSEEIQQTFMDRLKNEAGSMSPEFAARLGMAATGAAVGGVFGGAGGHPIAGALAGGLVGGALSPAVVANGLKTLGMHPQHAEEAAQAVKNPEDVKSLAQKLYSGLPQFQRFNLLMDHWGLPANAIAGPYGSAAMAGLEAHLSGDPRGAEVLKRLNPADFMKRWAAARDEAQKLVEEGQMGRAETQVLGSGPAQHLLQWPGIQMTAGDVASRQILVEAGFSEDEARVITMTSEPFTKTGKNVANFSKGSPLLQLLQPFARTPANIAEQGALRTPILGSIVQQLGKDTPDPWRQQLVQQGVGLASGVAGYEAGRHLDPETAKIVRRYATNLGGQYSLPVGLGFAAGQAVERGGDMLSPQTAANLYNALPLPSTAPLASWAQAAAGTGQPRGIMPTPLLNILDPTGGVTRGPLTKPKAFGGIRRR